jgi:ribosomal protein S18 acetylase RimI-like enzyme
MASTLLPPSPTPGLRTVELTAEWEARLQGFFESNPEYFLAVHGERAGPSEAHEEIHGGPPSGWSFTKKWLIGYVDTRESIVAMADVVADLPAPTVWHIGLFIVATARHGSGEAQLIAGGLESWVIENGAKWLRLGVAKGNSRAERFWESLGFQDARMREGVEIGKRKNSIRIMFKSLAGGTREQYLSLVDRDRPESA